MANPAGDTAAQARAPAQAGAAPGSDPERADYGARTAPSAPDSDRHAVTVHVVQGASYRRTTELAEVPQLLADGARLWIDAEGGAPGFAEFLIGVLKLHPLAVEDILQDRPIPKIEDYGDYLYLVAHGIVCDKVDPLSLLTIELDIVITSQWVMTHHTAPSMPCQVVAEECLRTARVLERGPAFVAHAILDRLVDYYLPVMEAFDEDIDQLETAVIERPSPDVLTWLFRRKRTLQWLRRIAVYQREVLGRLARAEFEQIPERALPFYRDVCDHFVRVADLCDGNRELLSNALDAYLSMMSNRMNEIMKALTLVSTVMLPLSVIAGIYGMNFEHMPELRWRFGYYVALGSMLAVAIGMGLWFRLRKWA